MSEDEKERLLAECLEEYHRRRALREPISAEDFRTRLQDLFGEFCELLAAESSLDAVMEPETPGEVFPRPFGAYTLLRELGGGAMGVVYEAVHRDLGRKVALKILRTGFDTEPLALERFRREARACAQVRHPNVVEIYEAGQAEGRPFYAMPILTGKSLAELVKDGAVPEPRELCRGMAGIADALDALHSAGIVHRDIKPANIMVSPDGNMILADFGLARTAASQALTQTGQTLGTPLYMSPEQVIGKKDEVDGRSDIYGLGVTLYEALSGRPPFKAEGFHSLMRLILTERPKPLTAVAPDVPRECALIAMKAMEREKRDRYQTASEMKRDLLAFVEGMPVSGRPVPGWRVFVRRNRLRMSASAALLAVVLVASWFWFNRAASLAVSCFPDALVQVDGREVGATPVKLSLEPGPHVVVVRQAGFGERRLDVDLGPGEMRTLETVLIAAGSDDPETLALLARAMDVRLSKFEEGPRFRSGEAPDIELLWPRGDVRAADLYAYRIDIPNPAFEFSGELSFRRGGEVLFSAPFMPEDGTVEEALPEGLVARLKPGDVVEWGYYPRAADKEPFTAAFRFVGDVGAVALATVEAKLKDQPESVRAHFRAQVLLDSGLSLAAYREAGRVFAKNPASARALAVMQESLRRLKLDTGTEPWVNVLNAIDDLPPAAKAGTFGR